MSNKKRPGLPSAGPTGDYPMGVYGKHDEGALNMAIQLDLDAERINVFFNTDVAWLGLDEGSARDFAQTLLRHANTLQERREAAKKN